MSAVGIISGLKNNLIDDPTGCKVKVGYSNYDFSKYSDYEMHITFTGLSTQFSKTLTESDVAGGTITWDLGIGSVLYPNRIASQILLLMQSLQKLEYTLTIQANDSTTQAYSDSIDGVFETSSENSAPIFNGISSVAEQSILLNLYMNGVHVKGISSLQIVPATITSSSYRNFAKNAGSGTANLLIASMGYGDNQVSSDNLVLNPNDCGDQQISLTLYDSRGYGATGTADVLVYDRSPSYIEDTSAIDRIRSDSSTTGIGIDIHGYYSAIKDSTSALVNRPYIWYKFGFKGTGPTTYYNVGNWIVFNPTSSSWYVQSEDGYFSLNSNSFSTITTYSNPVSFANTYLDYDIYMEFAVCDKLQGLDWTIGGTGQQLALPPENPDDTQHFDILKYTPTVALRSGKVGINKRNPQSAVDISGDVTLAGDLSWTLSDPSSHINQALGTDASGNVGWRTFPSAPVTSVDGNTGDVVLNDVKYSIQSKTDAEKTQARTNIGAASSTDLSNYILISAKAVANGVATLNNNGKIPMEQLDDAIAGNLKFQDTWNASTNTPTLPAAPAYADKGKYWITTVAGTFQSVTYNIGDWIISNWTGDESTGSGSWRRVPNTDAVSSVNNKTGAVVLTASDIGVDTSLYLPKAGGIMSGELQMGYNDISGIKDLGAQKLFASSGVYGLNLYYRDGSSFKNVKTILDAKAESSDLPVANPGETATGTLTKLKVGSTVYNVGSGGGTVVTEVFVVTYGSSTHADILAAYNAGKVVICKYMGKEYYLSNISSSTNGIFIASTADPAMYIFGVSTSNTYSTVTAINLVTGSYLPTGGGTMSGDIDCDGNDITDIETLGATTIGATSISGNTITGRYLKYTDIDLQTHDVQEELESKADSSDLPVANPSGTSANALNSITINGTNYYIPGASTSGLPTTGGTMTGDILFTDSGSETLNIDNAGTIKAKISPMSSRAILQYNNGSSVYDIFSVLMGLVQVGYINGRTDILSNNQPRWYDGTTYRNLLVAKTNESSNFGNADYQKVVVNGDGTRTLYIKKSFDVTEINATGGMYWGDAGYITQYLGISGSHEDFSSIISVSQSAIFESGGSGYATNAYTWLGAVYTSPTNSKCIPNLYLGRGTNGKLKGTYFITIVGT